MQQNFYKSPQKIYIELNTESPQLLHYTVEPGAFIPYKERSSCWLEISESGTIKLTEAMMDFLNIGPGIPLLSIRSSDIAFTMGVKGPFPEKSEHFNGAIPEF